MSRPAVRLDARPAPAPPAADQPEDGVHQKRNGDHESEDQNHQHRRSPSPAIRQKDGEAEYPRSPHRNENKLIISDGNENEGGVNYSPLVVKEALKRRPFA